MFSFLWTFPEQKQNQENGWEKSLLFRSPFHLPTNEINETKQTLLEIGELQKIKRFIRVFFFFSSVLLLCLFLWVFKEVSKSTTRGWNKFDGKTQESGLPGKSKNWSIGKFHLNMRTNFFTLRVTAHWNRLPREVVDSPTPEIFQTCLNEVLCNLF